MPTSALILSFSITSFTNRLWSFPVVYRRKPVRQVGTIFGGAPQLLTVLVAENLTPFKLKESLKIYWKWLICYIYLSSYDKTNQNRIFWNFKGNQQRSRWGITLKSKPPKLLFLQTRHPIKRLVSGWNNILCNKNCRDQGK